MLPTLRILLALLGLSAIAICLSMMLTGASVTVAMAESMFGGASGDVWPATMDSELRFYAPFWGSYGILLVLAALNPVKRSGWVPWLAAVFFAGGIGRLISLIAVGWPHPAFVVLMAIELLLPPLLIWLWRGARKEAAV
jgi:hypothetical protein